MKSTDRYSQIRVAMFNPGSMGSGLMRDRPWLERTVFGYALNFPRILNHLDPKMRVALPSDSAKSMMRLVEDPKYAQASPIDKDGNEVADGGAAYYDQLGVLDYTHGEANDAGKCKELWDDSAQFLGYTGDKKVL